MMANKIPSVQAENIMADLIASFDWGVTSLGPIADWPASLKAVVDILLVLPMPAVLLWGDDCIQIYNDGYRALLGTKHPGGLGQPNRVCCPEMWHFNEPLCQGAMQRRESSSFEDMQLSLINCGRTEPGFFRLAYCPVSGGQGIGTGTVGGVLLTVQETTARVRARSLEAEHARLAKALHAQRTQLLEDVFRNAPSFLHVLRGPEFIVELANDAYYRLVGHRDLLGRPAVDTMPEAGNEGFHAILNRVRSTGEPFIGRELPVTLARRTGVPLQQRYIDLVYQPLFDVNGICSHVLGHGVDVTEQVNARKQAEHELAVSRQRFEFLAQALERLASAHTHADVMQVVFGSARQLSGADGIAIVLRDGKDCFFLSDEEPIGERYWTGRKFPLMTCVSGWAMQNGHTLVIADLSVESRVPRPMYDATSVRSLVSVPVGGNDPFAAVGVYWSVVHHPGAEEITVLETLARAAGVTLERREAEERLRASEERFRALAELNPEGILINVSGRYAYANPAAVRILGARSAEDIIGLSAFDLVQVEHRKLVQDHMNRVRQGDSNPLIEIGLRRLDGLQIDAEATAGPIIWNGRAAVQFLIRDVTERRRGQEVLRESREQLAAALAITEIGTWRLDITMGKGELDPMAARILGFPEDTKNVALADVLAAFHPDDRVTIAASIAKIGRDGIPFETEHRILLPHEKQVRWVHSRAGFGDAPTSDSHVLVGASLDITERKRAEDALRESEERYRALVDASSHLLYRLSPDLSELRTIDARGSVAKIAGPRQSWMENYVHPDDQEHVKRICGEALQTGSVFELEHRVERNDGSWGWIFSRAVPLRNEQGEITEWFGMATDVTDRKQTEESLWKHANFDILTGLPNRRLFRDRLDQEVKKALRTGLPLALLFIDLDRFKEVNDLLGHDAGDQLLTQAARRISACVRGTDTVARLGGDEFTAILSELDDLTRVQTIAQKIITVLATPFQLGNEVAYLSASIGITLYPADASTAENLIRNADQAMYAAKNAGRSEFSYFTQSMQHESHHRLRLIRDLRCALTAGQLEVYYQPVVGMASGHIVKAEALLRWHHPRLGPIDPLLFIPLAEESGLINEIGDWVFTQAAGCAKQWGAQLGVPFQISVNRSPIQFRTRTGEINWANHLGQLGLPGNSISVEITEGLLLNASSGVTDKLVEYRDAGIEVAIDDFGTGYSSLAYLKKFDIDYLKIDQSFIHDMAHQTADWAIVRSMIAMAHELGLKVIAEGIETQEQRALLIDAGCDFGQGFLFSRAIPAAEFERVLRHDFH